MPWFWRPLFLRASALRYYSVVRKAAIVLRPYQESCLEACIDALKEGSTRIGVSLPTGSGKTTVFISLLSRLATPPESPQATRSLVIVNSVELAQQTADQAKRLFPQWSVEIEQGKHHASGLADLTVATFQTLVRAQRLEKFRAEYMKALIVDEAHHAAAPSYRRILSHFHPDIKNPEKDFVPPQLDHRVPVFGFSATFSRHDGLALGSVFERIVYHRDFLDMIKEQWLCNVRFTTVRANIDLSEVTVNARTGEFNPTSLAHVVNTETVNDLVVRTWLDKASDRKSTLVFCVNLAHVAKLTAAFRAAGVDARYIHANTPAAERKLLVEAFRGGRFPVLINCAVLTEGADIPNIDCVMVARPTRSRNMFAQMIGRGMRLSPDTGKQDCRIIDFVDSQERVAGVISSPTLFGLDPNEVTDDETLETLEERMAANETDEMMDKISKSDTNGPVPAPKSVTYIDHDDPFVLADQASGDPNIRQLSRNAWVCCGDGIYILECLGHGYIRVEPAQDESNEEVKYHAHYTPPTMPKGTAYMLKISPFRKSKHILSAGTLAEAIRGCDTYAQTKVLSGNVALGLLRGARWRWEPATDSQRQFILKRWKARKVPVGGDIQGKVLVASEDGLQNLKKGEAANIITRLKHGAQSRHEKRRKEELKAALVIEKEAKRRAREEVKVGLLTATA
ncbi:P-loop containing nucleoside triphosphate hydrolase protein [Trametes coccinea BRFM310]|uniref:p-loop containing nucleoside triphosphate hydrolase protein n=1 Tax=Trametes coccinea (strain BRFM310) TaxID=1353009 RepID=A0A1Y2IPV5_TRAC3|nr:P-loop containing nucleoside triphosphate hydrolase protein [Trametes coccinea BRFM310]